MSNITIFLNSRMVIMLISIFILIGTFFISNKFHKLKKIFIILTIIYNLIYLFWRTIYTLPLKLGIISIILGFALLLAEWMGFWQSLVFRLLFWKPYKNSKYSLEDFDNLPTVDVFIATYNETEKILKRTITGCLNLDYPDNLINIYICDDGHRMNIRQLCDSLRIHYITRDNNTHAKAGNINNALGQTTGEFIMLLDADMVPKSNFLGSTLGAFTDKKMGFIQTPQIFYNPDPFQFNLKFNQNIPNEQDFFMIDIQSGRDNYNAVLHVGTNAIFRRKALEDIGGIPTGTITEDMATGMLIQAKGYHTKFINEILCTGLSVESFTDLVKQRERWCRGNIQVTKKWNPLTMKGLSPIQRLIYIDGFIYWFSGVQKLIFLLCPIIYLIFNIVILNASINDLLIFWLPSFIASALTFKSLVHKGRSITWSHIYETAMAPFIALAALVETIFSRPIPFRVTPKGTNTAKTSFSFRIALPHIILLILTVFGLILSYPRFYSGSDFSVNSTLINIAWSVYNMFAIILSILVCLERPRKRNAERLVTDEKIQFNINESASCRIVDISETGIKVECDDIVDIALDYSEPVNIVSPDLGNLKGHVAWKKNINGKTNFGITFVEMSKELYSRIVRYITDRDHGYYKKK